MKRLFLTIGILIYFCIGFAAAEDVTIRIIDSVKDESWDSKRQRNYLELGIRYEQDKAPLSEQQFTLISEYQSLEDRCRGSYPGPEQDEACNARDSTELQLKMRIAGLCFGTMDSASMSDMSWHQCHGRSNGFALADNDFILECNPLTGFGEIHTVAIFAEKPRGISQELKEKYVTIKTTEGSLIPLLQEVGTLEQNGKPIPFGLSSILIRYSFKAPFDNLINDLLQSKDIQLPYSAGNLIIKGLEVHNLHSVRDALERFRYVCKG